MATTESANNFNEAGGLFKQERYKEALAMLSELNRAHPNTQRILYPMALCHSKLNQFTDAMQLADRLILEFEYEPARKLQAELREKTGIEDLAALTGLADLDLGLSGGSSFGSPAASAVGPPVLHVESSISKYFNLILVAIFLAILAAFIVTFNQFGYEYAEWQAAFSQQSDTLPPFPVASAIYNLILHLVLAFFAGCIGAYCGLAVVQALPEDDFNDNLRDIALYVLYGTLLMFIPFLGWIAILVIVYKHYDLRIGSLIVTVFMCILVWLVIYYGLAFFIGLVSAFL